MKYGRALRIARFALTIAIIAILVVPLVASIANTNATEIKVGVESRYDLEGFNSGSGDVVDKQIIKYNLGLVKNTDGNGWDGKGTLEFFGDSGASKSIPTSTIDGAVTAIYGNRDTYKTVEIHNTENKILTQDSIQYHDKFKTTVVTGIKVPDGINGLASYSVDLSFVGTNVDFKIPYGSSEVKNGYLLIKTEIPDILNLLCNSVEHNMEFKVHVSVLAVANFVVDVDVLTQAAIKPTYPGTYTISFPNVAVGTTHQINIGSNVYYKLEGNGVTFKSNGGLISDELTASIVDGKLTLQDSEDSSSKLVISGDVVYDIISIVKYLEAQP